MSVTLYSMYDSAEPSAIPPTAPIVAGYVDGLYAWKPADWARFPHATHVTIATGAASLLADVLDVENGDATPAEVPEWLAKRAYIGAPRGVIYTSLSNWPNVTAAVERANVPASRTPMYWIAEWNGDPTIPQGAIAKQYRSPVAPFGGESPGHYDVSSCTGLWPGLLKPPPSWYAKVFGHIHW